jgi:hypothetical protein
MLAPVLTFHAPAHTPRRFWQCQPPGYTAPPEAKKTVTFTVTQTIPKVTKAQVKSDALASGMEDEVNAAVAGGWPAPGAAASQP